VCGIIVSPLFLLGLIEICLLALGRPRRLGRHAMTWAVFGTGLVSAAIEVSQVAANVYRFAVAAGWLLVRAALQADAVLPGVRHEVPAARAHTRVFWSPD
jgi:hypothetical protein